MCSSVSGTRGGISNSSSGAGLVASGGQQQQTYWRTNEFGDIKAEANSANVPNMNIFPVAFNFADFTSSLAQRGSEYMLNVFIVIYHVYDF